MYMFEVLDLVDLFIGSSLINSDIIFSPVLSLISKVIFATAPIQHRYSDLRAHILEKIYFRCALIEKIIMQ
jgi:hypothetical protein